MQEISDFAVAFQGVSKRYKHFALDNVDLELEPGSIMGFIGANGAGKSTTIRILMGLVKPDQGQVTVLGLAMPQAGAEARQEIGFVSEDMRLYGAATLGWHMEFVRGLFPKWDQSFAEKLLRRFDLKAEQKVKGLSHGQRVKAALLLALARRPKLLVLDEPTTGLDPVARYEVLGELMEVLRDEDRTILFSSHNTQDVEQISDTITFIDRGRIIDSESKEIFLDKWRRLRLVLPENAGLPRLPGIIEVGGSGRLPVLTTNSFEPAMVTACSESGATVQGVDAMTLEEIFVANVHSRRERQAV
jgi:ABC-2 type transport system ATP-binding protein